jgi:ligand-binding sensor domain-containing protein
MVGAQKMLELSVANGLSNSFVTAITQDSMGYIWAGTLNGLNRYDGHAIDVFSTRNNDSQSLANNFVNNLVTDNLGRMWVITKKSIQVYQPLTGKYQTPSGISAIGDVTIPFTFSRSNHPPMKLYRSSYSGGLFMIRSYWVDDLLL